jgi:hypothetical protein
MAPRIPGLRPPVYWQSQTQRKQTAEATRMLKSRHSSARRVKRNSTCR